MWGRCEKFLLEFTTHDNYILIEKMKGGFKDDQRRSQLPSTVARVL
jgi:hypothetical protein